MTTDAINTRYSELSESACCLSCGGAIHHAHPMPGEVCVDLGSGRGNDVIRLAEAVGTTGQAYGVDISDGMIAKAKLNIQKLDIANATILKAELEHLPLQKETVDLVISNCTINHSTNKQAVWNEIYRILKEEGRFVVSDIYAVQPIADEDRNNPEAVAECWAGSVTKPEYMEMLHTAGFVDIRILEESAPYPKGRAEVASFTIAARKPVDYSCV